MNLTIYRNTIRNGTFVLPLEYVSSGAQFRRIQSAFLSDLYERVLCN